MRSARLFRSMVHATDCFYLLKKALPLKAAILTNKKCHFGTENGQMVAVEYARGHVINRSVLMTIVLAHPDGKVIAQEYNQPMSNRPAVMSADGIATFNQAFRHHFIDFSFKIFDCKG